MPLPPNGTLSLQGHVGPGGADSSKPKQAMIVRMSAETFEALETQPSPPKLEVEFGDSPGIHIGNSFFPMRPHQETSPHELYIRAVPANKTTAPLKFYAKVVGKFMVERQLGSRVESLVRDKTAAAEKQRTERKTIMLDAPPLTAPPVKPTKKKTATTKRHTVVEAGRSLSASSSAQPSRMVSPRPPPIQAKEQTMPRASPRPPAASASNSDRGRLIHFLALGPRTVTDVMKYVGGVKDDEPFRHDLVELLKAVAQPSAKQDETGPTSQKWLLKLKSWLEIKPFTFPNLSSPERLRLAKKAQSAYENMGIPESDPGWEDIRVPSSGSFQARASSVDSRRAAASQDSTAKPTKVESSGKTKIVTAGQSGKAGSTRPLKIAKYAEDDLDAAGTARASARRVPGSGFKMKAGSNTPPAEPVTNTTEPGRKTNDARSMKTDVSSGKSSQHASSLPPASTRDARPTMNHTVSTTRVPQSAREAAEFARPGAPGRDQSRASPAPMKRKKAQEDHEVDLSELEGATSQKKRRIEEEAPQVRKERDLSLPKKPAVREPSPPRPKATKQDGPPLTSAHSPIPPVSSPRLPPSKTSHHDRAPSFSSNRSRDDASHRGGSVKPRRKSPVFTSSEDEKEEPRRHADTARRRDEQRHERPSTIAVRKQTSLPDSPEVLKKMYNRKWLIYQSLRARHCALVEEIQDLLHDGAEEIYLPEGDTGLPHPEELVKLRADLDRETSVLHEIIEKWEVLMLQGKTAEGPLAKPNDV